MKKKKLIIIIGVVVVLLGSGFFVTTKVLRGMGPEKKTDRVETVRRGPFVVKLSESGNMDSLVKVEVRSNVEGEVDKLYVDEGYDVVKGQQLLKIDEKQIKEEYNQVQANYSAAQAELDRAKENSRLNMDRLNSDILLARNSLDSSNANLEGTNARASQQLSQARISITNTENLIEQDEINIRKAKLAIEQADTNEKSALALLNNAKAELDRKKDLYTKKFVPLRDVENAQLSYSSAQAQYDSAINNGKTLKESAQSQEKITANRKVSLQSEKDDLKILADSIKEQKRQADIQIKQAQERLDILKKGIESEKQIAELALKSAEANKIRAQSNLKTVEQRLGWTTVIAPITGRIVQSKVEEGEIITSGRTAWSQGPPIMTIADLSQMIVKTKVHEFDISKVKVGQKAEIKVGSYKDDVFEGVVKEISPSAQFDNNVIKFEVTTMIVNSPKPLLPGMTADVDIIVSERDNVLQLPLEAINMKETVKIKTDVQNEMLKKLKGQKVDLVLTKFPDKKFNGKVTNIATEKAGFLTSEVTVTIDEAPKELPSGMTSIADIVLSNGERISNIEIKAESEREYFVKVIKDTGVKSEKSPNDGKIAKIRNFFSWKSNAKTDEPQEEEKVIKIGERTQSSIEILEGLKEGDKVMIIPIGGEDKNKKKEKKENQG
jgi:HlyD family secretion protein